GDEQRLAPAERRGGHLDRHAHIARPRLVERRELAAPRPGPAGDAEDDAVGLMDELGEAQRADHAVDAPASGEPAQPEQRADDRVRRNRDPERRRDRVLRPGGHAAPVHLARVVLGQQVVESRHFARRYPPASWPLKRTRPSPPSLRRTPPSASSATSGSTPSPRRTPTSTRALRSSSTCCACCSTS